MSVKIHLVSALSGVLLLGSTLSHADSLPQSDSSTKHFRITDSGITPIDQDVSLVSTPTVTNATYSLPVATNTTLKKGGVQPIQLGNATYSKPYKVKGKVYTPFAKIDHFEQEGMASWYGGSFHGRRTANGESFDKNAFTAAHKELPLHSLVRVTHATTGKSVIVRINDRGPFHGNRIIDLSYAAAKQLGITQQGQAKVKIELLNKGRPTL